MLLPGFGCLHPPALDRAGSSPLSRYALAMRCPALLFIRYAMSGTSIGDAATVPDAVSGTDLGYAAHMCYAEPVTDLLYAATRHT
eukprot:3450768-Rhodomonas_salina.4